MIPDLKKLMHTKLILRVKEDRFDHWYFVFQIKILMQFFKVIITAKFKENVKDYVP